MKWHLVLPILGCVSGYAVSGAIAASTPLQAADISARIDRLGAKSVVRDLDDRGRFEAVLERIGNGDAAWIALAPRLVPGVDGADAEGLGIVLAQALPIDAVGVLSVVEAGDGVIGLRRVCGIPFIETTHAQNAAYESRALAALRRVRDPALVGRRDRCRAALTAP